MAVSVSSKNSLPTDLLKRTFSFFDWPELASASRVSRLWQRVAENNVLWKKFLSDDGVLFPVARGDRANLKRYFLGCAVRSEQELMQRFTEFVRTFSHEPSRRFVCRFPNKNSSFSAGWGYGPISMELYYMGQWPEAEVKHNYFEIAGNPDLCSCDVSYVYLRLPKGKEEIKALAREMRSLIKARRSLTVRYGAVLATRKVIYFSIALLISYYLLNFLVRLSPARERGLP